MAGDAGDAGAGDRQSEEGEGGACGGEGKEPEDDRVSAELIVVAIAFDGGRVGPRTWREDGV